VKGTGAGGAGAAGAAEAAVERLVRRDRAVAAVALAGLTMLAWADLFRMRSSMTAADMSGMGMPGMGMGGMSAWSALDVALLFLMWAVMMTAMMLPSAAPMILLVASINRRRREQASPAAPTAAFAAGYVVVWTGFSAVAALTQWALHRAALLTPEMASRSPLLGGALLVIAGVYQWLPVKGACLHHCRSPLLFLGESWREGAVGAVLMGMRHGLHCLGCCWALMALLFVAGVMNLVWVAVIAGLVLVERLARAGPWIGRAAGIALVIAGGWMLTLG
jgi:predicted metal-binding membrane protein